MTCSKISGASKTAYDKIKTKNKKNKVVAGNGAWRHHHSHQTDGAPLTDCCPTPDLWVSQEVAGRMCLGLRWSNACHLTKGVLQVSLNLATQLISLKNKKINVEPIPSAPCNISASEPEGLPFTSSTFSFHCDKKPPYSSSEEPVIRLQHTEAHFGNKHLY